MTASGRRSRIFHFTALPGQTIALVGPTGAGKSTAIALLHRAFDPQSGIIKIDGMDIRALKLTALRRNIGVVFQEALLFNRSIADNLRVGKPDATDEEMRIAAARAQALEFIERGDEEIRHPCRRARPHAVRRRAAAAVDRARALLKDPPILILDEATSALDAVTEAKVNAALDEVMKGRTTFVIAHRLSTIRNATRILVFDNGRVDRKRNVRRTGEQGRPLRGTRARPVHGAGKGAGRRREPKGARMERYLRAQSHRNRPISSTI